MPTTNGSAHPTHTEADYTDFAHTGPGTLAGRFMRRFWQPVYLAAKLPPGREINGRAVRVPSHAVMQDARGADTLRVELEIEDAIGSDTRTSLIERGDAADARRILKPYFIQMKGQARISGRVGGSPVSGTGTGFFETYR